MSNTEYRTPNVEGVRFTSCVSSKLSVRFYCGGEEFRFIICSIIPACFSRASANLRSGIGMCGLGAARMKHAGPPAREGAMKCAWTYYWDLYSRGEKYRTPNIELRMSKECVLPLAYPL